MYMLFGVQLFLMDRMLEAKQVQQAEKYPHKLHARDTVTFWRSMYKLTIIDLSALVYANILAYWILDTFITQLISYFCISLASFLLLVSYTFIYTFLIDILAFNWRKARVLATKLVFPDNYEKLIVNSKALGRQICTAMGDHLERPR